MTTQTRTKSLDWERMLHSQGIASRKNCRLLIQAGRIRWNDLIVEDARAAAPLAELQVGGTPFYVDDTPWFYRERVILVLHKPSGYECSHKVQFHPSVYSLLPAALVARGVECVGRLDADTTGLLIFTDDGKFHHHLISPKHAVPKLYEVTLKHPATDALVHALKTGVQLDDEPAPIAATDCVQTGGHTLLVTLIQGKYHQVKRMIAAGSNRVEVLHRSQFGQLRLDNVAPSTWRYLDETEVALLG